MATTDLTKTLADLAELWDYLQEQANVFNGLDERFADAVDAAIRVLEKTKE